jgi:hypothetical protein
MEKMKKVSSLVVIPAILFVTGLVFSSAFRSEIKSGVPAVLGNEDESEDGDNREAEKKQAEIKKEETKKIEEKKGESEKKAAESKKTKETNQQKSLIKKNEGEKSIKNGDEQKDEIDKEDGEDGEDGEESSKDLQEKIQELNRDIKKIDARIGVLSANGIVVTTLTSALEEVKALVLSAEALISTTPIEAKSLLNNADKKLEKVEKLIKLTLGNDDEEDNDNDAAKKIRELKFKISKTEARITKLKETGVDVTALVSSLTEAKELLTQASDKLVAVDLAGAKALAELAEKKLDKISHGVELALGDDDREDGDEADEYKNEVSKSVRNLKELGAVEDGLGKKVNVIAQAQNADIPKVAKSIKDINDRGNLLKFFIGPKYGSLAEIQTAIVENQTRASVLTGLVAQATDPIVKGVLQDQINVLNQQNAKLQVFVTDSESGFSLLGWVFKMFS